MADDTITAEQLPDAMAELAEQMAEASLEEPFKECAGLIRTGFATNFERQASPTDTWPPRKDKTKTHPLLFLSGDMFRAATQEGATGHVEEIGKRQLDVGIDGGVIPYAATHQFGDPDRNIAQREFIAVDDIVVDDCAEIMADGVLKAVFGD